ncbi:hypothetical protein FMEAI12_4850012 [Parafrankia sp. Ea1.12]|nr:hypothetical protein FMEAI12_4850012 [Parafrankia sp. Ea1.12]
MARGATDRWSGRHVADNVLERGEGRPGPKKAFRFHPLWPLDGSGGPVSVLLSMGNVLRCAIRFTMLSDGCGQRESR